MNALVRQEAKSNLSPWHLCGVNLTAAGLGSVIGGCVQVILVSDGCAGSAVRHAHEMDGVACSTADYVGVIGRGRHDPPPDAGGQGHQVIDLVDGPTEVSVCASNVQYRGRGLGEIVSAVDRPPKQWQAGIDPSLEARQHVVIRSSGLDPLEVRVL